MGKATVAVLKVKADTVLDDIQRLCDLAGLAGALDASADTLVKDEIGWQQPMPAVSTTAWQLEGTFQALRAAGHERVACIRQRPPTWNPYAEDDRHHHLPICRRHRVPVLDKAKASDLRWVEVRPKTELVALPVIYRRGLEVPEYFLGKNIVHLPTLRSDATTVVAGAVASTLSGLLKHGPRHIPTWIHGALVDGLRLQRELCSKTFAIMDGTTAGNGPGPHRLVPIQKNLMLASSDLVALDAVAAKLMGFEPLSIEYIARADDAGLGVGDPKDISVIGDDLPVDGRGFFIGDGGTAKRLGSLLGVGPLKGVDRAVSQGPVAKTLGMTTESFFDLFKWPQGAKQSYEEWRGTSWGQLFDSYARGERA